GSKQEQVSMSAPDCSPIAGALMLRKKQSSVIYRESNEFLMENISFFFLLVSKADCYVELSLPTASPIIYRTQVIDNSSDPEWNETFHYRIHNAVKNILELRLFDKDVLISDELTSVVFDVAGIEPGRPLKNTFKLKEVSSLMILHEVTGDLDVRLGFDLCKEERRFLDKRKEIVSQALKRTLNLSEDPSTDEVPVVAVLGSGGGIRALTSFYGSLFGLQKLKLLDSVTYISGISGSTWCLSMLYQDPEWSCKDLGGPISNAQEKVSSSKVGAFSSERLKYYFQELNTMENDGRKVSFTDLWGLIVEYFLQQKEDQSKLSDQQEVVKEGKNPYPIYAAVNVRPNVSGDDFAEWCEFTPYEVGFRKYGAFVRTEDFDSEFFMGRLIKKYPEPRICYLQGMWGSAFAASLDDVFLKVVGSGLSFLESLSDVVKVVDDCRRFHFRDPMRLNTRLVIPGGLMIQIFQDFFKSRVTAGETFNFMHGLYLHRDYVSLNKFVVSKGNFFGTHLDAFPNMLTPMEENLYLVDGGFSINSPFPLVLQPERDVDIILSFNYSWEAPFEVLHLTQKYCEERDIPFPEIVLNKEDEENPKECYVFMDAENPKSPIILHFPLVNDTFHKFKAPGIERELEEDKSFGDFEIGGKDSPYRTLNFTYEPHEFNKLVELNCYNVLNNKDSILEAIRVALSRRKQKSRMSKIP
uniref:Phospholipase A2 n=1 Tax=Varanus komodoensis TaxID=61221 RepID=A0A8D2KWI8_VARKO